MSWSRRRVLQSGGVLAGMGVGIFMQRAGARPPLGAVRQTPERAKRVSLSNLHTGEKIDLEFSHGGVYVPEALTVIQRVLRDYRTGEQHVIDPALMDYLYDVALYVGAAPDFSVISGYRSPQTNERLRERSDGVARHSLHLEGRAIDVRLRGIDCLDLAGRAREMGRGGVGYYKASNFVHLDTGAVRTWNG